MIVHRIIAGEKLNCSEKGLYQFHVVHHRSDMDYPGDEPELLSELLHGPSNSVPIFLF